MAILIDKILTTTAGLSVPVNSIVVPTVHTVRPVPYIELNEEGQETTKYRRTIAFDNFQWISKQKFQTDFTNTNCILTKEIPSGWTKEMTDSEFQQLLQNGLKAEEWLRDYFNSLLGGSYCTIVDATV